MRTTALTLFASTLLLAGSVSGLSAQQATGPMMNPGQAGSGPFGPGMMFGGGPGFGMMGPGAAGYGMPGYGFMGHGMAGHGMRGPSMMLILMDTDGDGALSLEEFEAVHARMFKAMDIDSDGKLTAEEMEAFMEGEAIGSDEAQ